MREDADRVAFAHKIHGEKRTNGQYGLFSSFFLFWLSFIGGEREERKPRCRRRGKPTGLGGLIRRVNNELNGTQDQD